MGDKSAYMAHEGSTAYRTSVIFWNRILLLRLCHTMGWTRDSDLWKKKTTGLGLGLGLGSCRTCYKSVHN